MKQTILPTPFYKEWSMWPKLLVINTLIAIFLTLVTQSNFWINLIFSQCIGISIASLVCLIALGYKEKEPGLIVYAIAIILGVIIGISIASVIINTGKLSTGENERAFVLSSFIYSIMIGSVVVFYFSLIGKQQRITNQLNMEKLKQVEYERALNENNLKLLQAQIEPHFLFNTLSNVLSLIDSRPDDAKQMLEYFTRYLRASLSRTRDNKTTLGDEMEIVNAYLSIQKIRMGKRLNFKIEIAQSMNDIPFPPLLIQPLVENSVLHGLESEVEGGEISVTVSHDNNKLSISVADTGKGAASLGGDGIGLNNIRERLTALFQHNADIKTIANEPKGLIVTLTIPLDMT